MTCSNTMQVCNTGHGHLCHGHLCHAPPGQLTAGPGTSTLPLCHCTTSAKIMGSRAKASIQADSLLFPPPQSQQTERPKKQLPTSGQEFVPLLCSPVLAPLSLCKSDQKDSWPSWHIQGSCLPLTAPCQAPACHAASKADTAMEPLGRLPQVCIIPHPAGARCPLWTWLLGLAALWPPWKRHSTSPLARVESALLLPSLPCPGVRNHHAVLSPTAHFPLSACLWQNPGNCSTMPDWRRQKGVGAGYSHQAVLSGAHNIMHCTV